MISILLFSGQSSCHGRLNQFNIIFCDRIPFIALMIFDTNSFIIFSISFRLTKEEMIKLNTNSHS